jgi:NAD(P)-dependent dehydrogenase (short-subunit alcohol dehydrogenase family)
MNRTVVVVGAAGEMGRVLAQEWAADGADLVLLDRDPRVEEVAAQTGGSSHCVDALDDEEVGRVLGRLPRVDVLVTAVGLWPLATVDDLAPAEFRRQVAVNLDSAYVAVHASLAGLRAAQGAVVCLSSAVGLKGHAEMIPYAAAKSGVHGLVRALALALGPDGVRVNAVSPGLVATPRMRELWGPERTAAFRSGRALADDITVADVVSVVRFLAGPGARMVTGQTLVVDGGSVLH